MEFSSLIDTRNHIEDKFTPAGGADAQLISAEELRKASAGLQEFLTERGIVVKNAVADFATLSGTEAKLAFLKNKGLYQFQSSGVANGSTILTAAGGGVFVQILKVSAPEEIQFTNNGTYNLPAKTTLLAITVLPASSIQFRMGTSPNGEEIIPEVTIDAQGDIRQTVFWKSLPTTIYLSGITVPTTIAFITL